MNDRKLFLCVGIPALALYFFMASIYFAFIGGMMLLVFITGACCLRKKDFWTRANKLSIAMLGVFVLLVPNPLMWPQQVERHVNPTLLITPNDPAVQDLNSTGKFWAWLMTNSGLSANQFEALEMPRKLNYISNYCLTAVVQWTSISDQYGVIARVATPAEAIAAGKGDCQAQAVTTTSFLIYLGYNAYAGESPLHWYTVVYLADGTPIYLDRAVNNGLLASDQLALINDKGIWYSRTWATVLPEILFNPHLNIDFVNVLLQTPVNWAILVSVFMGAGVILAAVIRAQDRVARKALLKDGLITGGLINGGCLVVAGISLVNPLLTFLLLLVAIVAVVQLVSHNFFRRETNAPQ